MNSTELIAIISQPADSSGMYAYSLPLSEYMPKLDRYVAWWRWGKDDNPHSIVATATSNEQPIIEDDTITMNFRPTNIIFTQGGQLLRGHTVSGRRHCLVRVAKHNTHMPYGLADAVRSYSVYSSPLSPPTSAA